MKAKNQFSISGNLFFHLNGLLVIHTDLENPIMAG